MLDGWKCYSEVKQVFQSWILNQFTDGQLQMLRALSFREFEGQHMTRYDDQLHAWLLFWKHGQTAGTAVTFCNDANSELQKRLGSV